MSIDSPPVARLTPTLPDRTFEAIVFDWDGTAVPDRHADAARVRGVIERLCASGVHVVVVSGTHVGNVDGQLAARPNGPGTLHLCLNRGSEVFAVDRRGPRLVWRREATADEMAALDAAADLTVSRLAAHGLHAEIVSQRLNRRKIDIIPEPEWSDPPKARIAELLDAVTARIQARGIDSLTDVVELALRAAEECGLPAARVTSDVKHVEIGLTDKSDSMAFVWTELGRRGIGPGLVLVGGDEFGPIGGVSGSDTRMLAPDADRATVVSVGAEPGGAPEGVIHLGGGPDRFVAILEEQLERRAERRTPWIDEDPRWTVDVDALEIGPRAREALATLANGEAGVRGSLEEQGSSTDALFAVNGIYTGGSSSHLMPGPIWTSLLVHRRRDAVTRRVLDLHTGVLVRETSSPGQAPVRSMRFVSAAATDVVAMRAEGPETGLAGGPPLTAPRAAIPYDTGVDGGATWMRTGYHGQAGITVSVVEHDAAGQRDTIERIAAWEAGRHRVASPRLVARRARTLADVGFDRLLAEHRQAWAERWEDSLVVIEGDERSELAARFALFHLLAAAGTGAETAVGARGLSGPAYGGHVFWDADVFVLPALAAVAPDAALAMARYRVHRLAAARALAAERGVPGARFPWESADAGDEVTPRFARGADGSVVPIRTGLREDHISADVAWALREYRLWSGDDEFLRQPATEVIAETARFWAGRVRRDRGGRGHIYGVIGPDEYHEIVDDNAYTNVMARWNLRLAASLCEREGRWATPAEIAAWRAAADCLVDNHDPDTGRYEQFAGYFKLTPLLVAEVGSRPIAADLLLGMERVAASQLIKQADVLMLHHLVPEEVAPGSLVPNLDFYEPRTAHGSSLSPAIHALLLARAGRVEAALELFELACRLDLDDLTGTTAGGLHLATMGGVWQALAYGFLGLRPGPAALTLDPRLPSAWSSLELRFRYHGRRVRVRAGTGEVEIGCDGPLRVQLPGRSAVTLAAPGGRLPLVSRSPS